MELGGVNHEGKSICSIGNYYGCLHIKQLEEKYYWIIEDYDTDFSNLDEWDEISESLYLELNKLVDG